MIGESLEMVEFLLLHNATIDAQDNEGWSPLMAAVSCNFLEIARCLLKHGADPVLCNSDGELPVDLVESDEMRSMLEREIEKRGTFANHTKHTNTTFALKYMNLA